jgi:hypothetical protein
MLTLLLLALAAAGEDERALPAGTELSIRLTQPVAHHSAGVGDAVEAVLGAPVRVDGAPVVPAGWKVRGTVRAVGKVGANDHRPVLGLQFGQLVEFGGRPVFLGAATHDVGIFFSAQEKTFTHRIDSRIDLERDKIADDLTFAGAVEVRALVDRPQVPRSGLNAAGDRVETDGAVIALVLR